MMRVVKKQFCAVSILVLPILLFIGCQNEQTPPEPESIIFTKIKLFSVKYPFVLPPLPYAYNDLEPHIDTQTMNIHHTKHHQAYVDNLNKAIEECPKYKEYTLEDLLANLDNLPSSIKDQVKNNGGGHFSHMLFWDSLSPISQNPSAKVVEEINKNFGSFENFKKTFTQKALVHVGSGWIWLCVSSNKNLEILVTLNHETPLAKGLFPILVLDLWEHAYYLKYQNRRPEYVATWWNIINWENVDKLYQKAAHSL